MNSRAVLFVLVLTAGYATAACAGCPDVPGDAFAFISPGGVACPENPSVRWTAQTVDFDCSFFGNEENAIDCDGDAATCIARCRAAATNWNTGLPQRFVLAEATEPVEFCNDDDGKVSVGGNPTLCDGSSYGSRVLAVTLSIFFSAGPRAGELIDANITVNRRFQFTQDGFQATLAHEFGHVLGLSHPDQCGDDFNVLMRSASLFGSDEPCFVLDPTPADLNGAERIYPVIDFPTPTPTPTATPGICGDADSSGSITVTDGVQALRAAAELSSLCVPARCDIDGNGAITVTDGVNVLRGAAELGFTAACP